MFTSNSTHPHHLSSWWSQLWKYQIWILKVSTTPSKHHIQSSQSKCKNIRCKYKDRCLWSNMIHKVVLITIQLLIQLPTCVNQVNGQALKPWTIRPQRTCSDHNKTNTLTSLKRVCTSPASSTKIKELRDPLLKDTFKTYSSSSHFCSSSNNNPKQQLLQRVKGKIARAKELTNNVSNTNTI